MEFNKYIEIARRGYTPNPKIFTPDEQLMELGEKLLNLEIATTEYGVHRMTLDEALIDSKRFLDYYFKLHKVPYLCYPSLLGKKIPLIFKKHPYDLPLFETEEDALIFDGAVIEELTNSSRPKVLFRGIELSKTTTECTSATYVHEITHTQLDSVKGSIKEYYNAEILSMFAETFHYMEIDKGERLLRLFDSRRISELNLILEDLIEYKNNSSTKEKDELLEDSKYAISILKAYNLFITFYYENENIKNEILDDIQCIFDGYLTLEEMLSKYEVTLESSQEEKRLLKYFNR